MTNNNFLQLISLLSGSQTYIAWKLIMYNKDLGLNVHHHYYNISNTNESTSGISNSILWENQNNIG